MHTDLLLDPEHFRHGQLSLPHVLDSLHEQASMRALFGHQANNVHFIDLVADLEFVELRVQGFQVFADRVEQADEQGLLALDQINVHFGLGLDQLFVQVVRCLHGTRNVDQLRELELEVFL